MNNLEILTKIMTDQNLFGHMYLSEDKPLHEIIYKVINPLTVVHKGKDFMEKLTIIMIEELTDSSYLNLRGYHFDGKNGYWLSFEDSGWGYYRIYDYEYVVIPNDWLPYLHLAGNIFKESV